MGNLVTVVATCTQISEMTYVTNICKCIMLSCASQILHFYKLNAYSDPG